MSLTRIVEHQGRDRPLGEREGLALLIRNYEPGDERAQAEVYNAEAARLPGFKPATAEEVARRSRGPDPDATAKFYAVEGDRVVGYAVLNPNGRISYPWCLPGAAGARRPLLEAVLLGLRARGVAEAWAAYRADWGPVLAFFREEGFAEVRRMINYVADLASLPRAPVPEGRAIVGLDRADLPRVVELGGDLFGGLDAGRLGASVWENPWIEPEEWMALKDVTGGRIVGLGVAVEDRAFADPTKLDAAMPCFRLGALGTESQRHKRVNGLFSGLFEAEPDGEVLLTEAARRFARAGLAHAAAQAPSDRPGLVAFYDRFFRRQGSFPILGQTV